MESPGSAPDRPTQSSDNRHLWEMLWFQDLAWMFVTLILLVTMYLLREILQPVLLALFAAYLFNPCIVWGQRKWGRSRALIVNVASLTAAILLLVILIAVVPLIVDQASGLLRMLPVYAQAILDRSGVNSESILAALREKSAAFLRDPLENFGQLWDGFSTGVGFIGGAVGTAAAFTISLSLIPVYFYFFCLNWPSIVAWMVPFIPSSRRAGVTDVAGRMDRAVGGYFRTRLLIAFIMGVMYAVGWGIAGVPYWLILGLLGGVLGVIPYAAGLAWLAAILLRYLEFNGAMAGMHEIQSVFLWPTLVYMAVQASDDWLLTPMLQGRQLEMPMITIILAVLIGGAFFGLFGMLLAVPIAACLKIYWQEVLRPRLTAYAQTH